MLHYEFFFSLNLISDEKESKELTKAVDPMNIYDKMNKTRKMFGTLILLLLK